MDLGGRFKRPRGEEPEPECKQGPYDGLEVLPLSQHFSLPLSQPRRPEPVAVPRSCLHSLNHRGIAFFLSGEVVGESAGRLILSRTGAR